MSTVNRYGPETQMLSTAAHEAGVGDKMRKDSMKKNGMWKLEELGETSVTYVPHP
jgi:hypothetical protein